MSVSVASTRKKGKRGEGEKEREERGRDAIATHKVPAVIPPATNTPA